MREHVVLHGEAYISLEEVAHCYAIDVTVLSEAYELGLLGPGERAGDVLLIRVRELERVATIVRLHVHLGVNLEGIALTLGPEDPA